MLEGRGAADSPASQPLLKDTLRSRQLVASAGECASVSGSHELPLATSRDGDAWPRDVTLCKSRAYVTIMKYAAGVPCSDQAYTARLRISAAEPAEQRGLAAPLHVAYPPDKVRAEPFYAAGCISPGR